MRIFRFFSFIKFVWGRVLDKTVYLGFRQSEWIWPKYRIEGCKTLNKNYLVSYKRPFLCKKTLQHYFDEVVEIIIQKIQNCEKFSVIRVGDGEAYFLRGQYIGNIKNRHLTNVSLKELNIDEWQKALVKNDLITFDIRPPFKELWFPIFGKKKMRNVFPLDTVYALVATKKLFEILNGYHVGLIGPKLKLDLIDKLLQFDEYKKYLGIDGFQDYINVPQRGACNEIDELTKVLLKRVEASRSRIFLVGAGIAKMYFMSEIRDKGNVILIDIGSGIDALAGIIHPEKTLFGGWVNYRISDYDYSGIDVLWNQKDGIDNNVVWL